MQKLKYWPVELRDGTLTEVRDAAETPFCVGVGVLVLLAEALGVPTWLRLA